MDVKPVNNNTESKAEAKAKTPTPPKEELLTPVRDEEPGTPTKDEKPSSVLDGWKFSPKKPDSSATNSNKDQKFDAFKNLAENKKKRDMILKTEDTKTPSPAPGTFSSYIPTSKGLLADILGHIMDQEETASPRNNPRANAPILGLPDDDPNGKTYTFDQKLNPDSEADRLDKIRQRRQAELERRRRETARIDFMGPSVQMIDFEDQFKRQPSSIF